MPNQDKEAVILSGARTPTGRFLGSLSSIPAPRLGAVAVKAAVDRAGVNEHGDFDEVLMGNVVSAGLGQNPARQAAIFGGLPASVGATADGARRAGGDGRRLPHPRPHPRLHPAVAAD